MVRGFEILSSAEEVLWLVTICASDMHRACDINNMFGTIGDEFHMVFECPFYSQIRGRSSQLFERLDGFYGIDGTTSPAGPHMARFMSQDKRKLASFVAACWLLRSGSDASAGVLEESNFDCQ